MSNSFVSIKKWVILNHREHQSRRLLFERWIELRPAIRGAGLGHSGLKRSKVTKRRGATCKFNDSAVKVEHLSQSEVAHGEIHLRKAAIQVPVLLENAV